MAHFGALQRSLTALATWLQGYSADKIHTSAAYVLRRASIAMAEGETKGMVNLEKELSCSVSAFWLRWRLNDGRHTHHTASFMM